MTETLALRASDADRERAVLLLREHMVDGRLTLEEFTDRMSTAYAARTADELERLSRDLPAARARSRRRPTRVVLALLGSCGRRGRIRVHRWVNCLMAFGNIDLDLRQATLDGEAVTIVALGAFGAIDVYVPEGVEVDLRGFTLGGHRGLRGNDLPPRAGTPIVRVVAVSIFAGIDVWCVPIAWAERSWSDVIRGIRSGAHRELTA
jgi:Domain of unknown function (DUF1707)/Cell wall-active antibiotics response 4TMS YvqF